MIKQVKIYILIYFLNLLSYALNCGLKFRLNARIKGLNENSKQLLRITLSFLRNIYECHFLYSTSMHIIHFHEYYIFTMIKSLMTSYNHKLFKKILQKSLGKIEKEITLLIAVLHCNFFSCEKSISLLSIASDFSCASLMQFI